MTTSFYTEQELAGLGLKSFGRDVKLSRKASIYSPQSISLGSHVRIDDFCILSGRLTIGSRVHIAAYTALFGTQGIYLEDFVGLSSRVSVYTVSDDYLGNGLTGPTVPDEYRKPQTGEVRFGRHVVIGAGSVVLPGVTLGEGTTVGALGLVNASLPPWKVAVGIPARPRRDRRRDLIETYEAEMRAKGLL